MNIKKSWNPTLIVYCQFSVQNSWFPVKYYRSTHLLQPFPVIKLYFPIFARKNPNLTGLDVQVSPRLSGHPSKYWLRAALLEFGNSLSRAPTVHLLLSIAAVNYFRLYSSARDETLFFNSLEQRFLLNFQKFMKTLFNTANFIRGDFTQVYSTNEIL